MKGEDMVVEGRDEAELEVIGGERGEESFLLFTSLDRVEELRNTRRRVARIGPGKSKKSSGKGACCSWERNGALAKDPL